VLEVSPSADDSAVAFVRPREARGTALVVEDEPDLRTVVAQILREGGWDVTALSEGSEALAVIETRARLDRAPTLLVSDVIIPQTDGATIAHRFRDLFPDARIVLMSGYHEQPEVEALLARGNAAFVPKPFSPDDLVRAVQGASLAPTPTTVA
jgi:CheY-like chemotaxis protein